MPVQEFLKNTRVQVTCKTVAFRLFLTHIEVRVPWFSLRSRVRLHTHRTIVDGEKKSPTAITPRCPDNRHELRVHATIVDVVVVVITYSRVQINWKVANPFHMISWTGKKNLAPVHA